MDRICILDRPVLSAERL